MVVEKKQYADQTVFLCIRGRGELYPPARKSAFETQIDAVHLGGVAPVREKAHDKSQARQQGREGQQTHGRAQGEVVGQKAHHHRPQGKAQNVLAQYHEADGRGPRTGVHQVHDDG